MSQLQISQAINSPSGPWLIWEPRVLEGIMAVHASLHGMEQKPSVPVAGNQARVGIVNITGVLTKQGSWWGTSTAQVGSVVTDMANSGQFDVIVLRIDSVGGQASGVPEAAAAIKAASEKIRVIASIEDYGASAAYYLASQAGEVYANSSAVVGSIGTLMVIPDGSQMFASAGVKMNVIASGKFKGMGAWGAPVSEAHLAEFQKMVTQTNEMFLSAVQQGRKLSNESMATLAEARVYGAKEAQSLGLIDGVASFAQVLDFATKKQERTSMSNQNQATATMPAVTSNQTVPAASAASQQSAESPRVTAAQRDEQLKQLCKGCDADFRLSQIVAEATDVQAMQAWIERQNSVIAAAQKQSADSGQSAATAPQEQKVVSVAVGNTPTQENVKATSDTSVQKQWREAIAEKKRNGMKGSQAISAVVAENPDLAAAYNKLFA